MDFEKLGAFYLGKEFDTGSGKLLDRLVMYDSRDLTTHAVCVGMTGSGKTGLCIDLLEEAAIDKIPVIAIDPKGDLGNCLLNFPNLAPKDFEPWVNPREAANQGKTVPQYAAEQARLWEKGRLERKRSGRAYAYLPLHTRTEHAALRMEEILETAGDRSVALAQFAEQLSASERKNLKGMLAGE